MGRPATDLTGNRIGSLVVLHRDGSQGPHPRWLCRCDCGGMHLVAAPNLKSGAITRCSRCSSIGVIPDSPAVTVVVRAYYYMNGAPGGFAWATRKSDGVVLAHTWRSTRALRRRASSENSPQVRLCMTMLLRKGLIAAPENGQGIERWAQANRVALDVRTFRSIPEMDEIWARMPHDPDLDALRQELMAQAK